MIDPVFIIGAGRSGTTWLHLMLGSHPLIATGQESQLFQNYFRAMRKKWDEELAYPKDDNFRFHGISAYIDEARFYQLLRQFADGVFTEVMQAKPGAKLFLEKSPNNSFNIDTIARCYPEARFIHLIRDGRDVTSSVLAANKSWGRYWAPKYVEPAALEWKKAVRMARDAKKLGKGYLELRYEDMLTDGYRQLRNVFEFLDIHCTDDEIKNIYDAHAFDKLKAGDYRKATFINPGQTPASGTDSRSEPRDFFRKGRAGDWKESLDRRQLQEFYHVAGDLLEELDYEAPGSLDRHKPTSLSLRHGIARCRKNAGKLIKSIF